MFPMETNVLCIGLIPHEQRAQCPAVWPFTNPKHNMYNDERGNNLIVMSAKTKTKTKKLK
jgi:hypothetical protein